jgi:CRP/FNR family transcriptional regulator
MQIMREYACCHKSQPTQIGEFIAELSPAALLDLESIEYSSNYSSGQLLFSETQILPGVYFILAGEVKISMNSSNGKRMILHIAKTGEILGIASTLSGRPIEWSAETISSAKITLIKRREFLAFLMRHPEAYHFLTTELSRDLNIALEKLRAVGLSSSASGKLAQLLLDWSEDRPKTEDETKLRLTLTHAEIGEFIGISRETVTRILTYFKRQRLVVFHGCTVTIPSRRALESYALGRSSIYA